MVGPPGSGKTMLARRLSSILPPLALEEAIEVTTLWSVMGLLAAGHGLVRERPFRAPHHTISGAGLIGGGSVPHPGEVSLAHLGVLFFNERPQGAKDDPFEDSDTQPEKTERFRIETPSTFVKCPMRERKGGGIVIFVGVRSGLAASQ